MACRSISQKPLGSSGSSLIETMIALVVFAFAAVTILPMTLTVKKDIKAVSVKQLCLSAARTKLAEYVAGRPEPYPSVEPYRRLIRGSADWSGMPGTSSFTDRGGERGFAWAKLRYNQFFPRVCLSPSNRLGLKNFGITDTLKSVDGFDRVGGGAAVYEYYGMRECLGTNTPLADLNASGTSCQTEQDIRIQKELPGFKLFVRLELDSAFGNLPALVSGADFSTDTSGKAYNYDFPWLDNRCPIHSYVDGDGNTQYAYDFDGAGDGIRVTVTGVVDFPLGAGSAEGTADGDRFAGILRKNRNELMCTVTTVIRPAGNQVRFTLSRDGRVYRAKGTDLLRATNSAGNGSGDVLADFGGWPLASIYSSSASTRASGITGISVHPRNLAVYVLRAGVLTRYSRCTGVPLDCSTASTDSGIANDGLTAVPAVQNYPVSSSIDRIFLNFSKNEIYALGRDHTSIIRIEPTGGTSLDKIGAPTAANIKHVSIWDSVDGVPAPAPANLPEWLPRPMGSVTPTLSSRIVAAALAPSGQELIVSDLSNQSWDAQTFGTTLYRASDPYMTDPLGFLSSQTSAFSF